MKRILFDTETTDLLKARSAPLKLQPYIIELYMVEVDEDFKILDEINTFINIPIKVPPFITKINGITNADLEQAPKFSEIMLNVLNFLSDSDEIIAHQLPFDMSMLTYQFNREGIETKDIPFPKKKTCTIQKSMSLTGKRLSLTNLHRKILGKGFDGAHRAKDDVMALVRCYHKMLEMGLCK